MASLPLPTHSAAAASRGSNRRIPRATFVTPAPQLVSFGGGGLGSNSPQSSSAAASPSSSATTTIFHHHVAKMRRVLGGAVASSITRHRWRRLLNIIRFAARLRRVAQLGVKLTAFEREHLYKVYWEHSQRSGGLFDVESIARLLQEFNQPQPPTTVEQLLAHVHFRLPPTTSNSKSGSSSSGSGGRSQTPIAFYQVVQMLLHIKREHRALTQVSDEEELFLQLSSTNGGGAEHQPSADTAFHNNTNMEHTLKLHSHFFFTSPKCGVFSVEPWRPALPVIDGDDC
ncbi:Hypothetical protein, putative [Bodo saltans]|uniref:Uncharacterized protein n=1 Tax=Bodo saltans TaxID=75058 RepID=A0A0S4J4F5_BODSA|nr:Hypothetical protein, putative [Bodo saltans]|eukprot:CUG16933.1 Hypothetical protein, putative [Bodo saltans]